MSAANSAARTVAARLSPNTVAIDPGLIPLLEIAIAALVAKIRECYDTPESAFAYLTRAFGPLQWWRESRRDRLIAEAVDDAVADAMADKPVGVKIATFANVASALRSAIRDDLSRGMLAGLYEGK